MCQHTIARPAVQAAGAIPLLALLCDLHQWSLPVVRYASAALASIAVGPDVKVCRACSPFSKVQIYRVVMHLLYMPDILGLSFVWHHNNATLDSLDKLVIV